ncbi:unnamed protein product [Cochlearia groenlandica]
MEVVPAASSSQACRTAQHHAEENSWEVQLTQPPVIPPEVAQAAAQDLGRDLGIDDFEPSDPVDPAVPVV